jgi:FdrA protein
MAVKGLVRQGEYYDSVTLMRAGKALAALEGIEDAAIVMGTAENRAILASANLLCADLLEAGETDLLIAVMAATEFLALEGLARAEGVLADLKKRTTAGAAFRPRSLEGALEALPDARLALISVAGRFAGELARKALSRNLHVMLFSDNVDLATEIELKEDAVRRGLLLMGPDCGTAIINGVPLGFANAVSRGPIGIVAAAGTGLQEVTCLVSQEKGGVSQAIGTGGRDLKAEVGGLMFLESIKALLADEATRVLLLVSKPPHPSVLEKIRALLTGAPKPVVACFLGAPADAMAGTGAHMARTLEEAAFLAVALSRGEAPEDVACRIAARDRNLEAQATALAARIGPGRRYLRGLFSGGTFSYEAQLIMGKGLGTMHANAPAFGSLALESALVSVGHTVVDLGEDEFTVGRPHPMIDFDLRKRRLLEEGRDPETALVLLDVVLGYGSNMDPAGELVPALTVLRDQGIPVLCSITGTDQDPQDRRAVETALRAAGAVVMTSNAAACELALRTLAALSAPVASPALNGGK